MNTHPPCHFRSPIFRPVAILFAATLLSASHAQSTGPSEDEKMKFGWGFSGVPIMLPGGSKVGLGLNEDYGPLLWEISPLKTVSVRKLTSKPLDWRFTHSLLVLADGRLLAVGKFGQVLEIPRDGGEVRIANLPPAKGLENCGVLSNLHLGEDGQIYGTTMPNAREKSACWLGAVFRGDPSHAIEVLIGPNLGGALTEEAGESPPDLRHASLSITAPLQDGSFCGMVDIEREGGKKESTIFRWSPGAGVSILRKEPGMEIEGIAATRDRIAFVLRDPSRKKKPAILQCDGDGNTLCSFEVGRDIELIPDAMHFDSGGNLYGRWVFAEQGGIMGIGTVFRIARDGTLKVLAESEELGHEGDGISVTGEGVVYGYGHKADGSYCVFGVTPAGKMAAVTLPTSEKILARVREQSQARKLEEKAE